MDVSRAVYGRELKIAAMRALDAGATNGEIARKYQVSPHLLERWRGEWRAKGELAFLKDSPRPLKQRWTSGGSLQMRPRDTSNPAGAAPSPPDTGMPSDRTSRSR